MDDNERPNLENPHDKKLEELKRIYDGDGTLRLWNVMVYWIGGDDLPGHPEQREWADKGALIVQQGYITACVELDLIVSVSRMIGSQNKQQWLIRARSEMEAQAVALMSPLGELGMLNVLQTYLPLAPVLLNRHAAKIHDLQKRHPTIDRLLDGMTYEQLMQWFDEEDCEDWPFVLRTIIQWFWFRRLVSKSPHLLPGEMLDQFWAILVRVCSSHLAWKESGERARVTERAVRKSEAFLAEWGVDVDELRRRADKAIAEGRPIPTDDLPMKQEFLQPEDEEE